jgi:hypothetical protein
MIPQHGRRLGAEVDRNLGVWPISDPLAVGTGLHFAHSYSPTPDFLTH